MPGNRDLGERPEGSYLGDFITVDEITSSITLQNIYQARPMITLKADYWEHEPEYLWEGRDDTHKSTPQRFRDTKRVSPIWSDLEWDPTMTF